MLHTTLRNFTRRGASLRTITTAALRKRTTVHIAAANSLTRNVGVGAVLHPFPAVTSSQLFQTRSFASEGDVIEQPVPSMGDSITEGTLVEWAKDIGEYCAADDIVAVIETDKVSLDVRTDKAGTLESTLAEVDETVAVGAPLYTLKLGGDAPAVAESAPAAAVPAGDSGKFFQSLKALKSTFLPDQIICCTGFSLLYPCVTKLSLCEDV